MLLSFSLAEEGSAVKHKKEGSIVSPLHLVAELMAISAFRWLLTTLSLLKQKR